MRRRRAKPACLLLAVLVAACDRGADQVAVPDPDTAGMERRVAEAIAAARNTAMQSPDSAEAWGRLGIACQAHGMHVPAGVCYARAAELDPRDPRWPYFRAIALHARYAGDEAVLALFERAIALRPEDAPIRVRLGDALSSFGRRDEAASAYREALRLAPDLPRTQFALGRLLVSMGDADGAVAHLERADALLPRHGAIRAALAQAYARQGRVAEARSTAANTGDPAATVPLPDPLLQELALAAVSSEQCMERALQHMTRGRFDLAIRDLQFVEEVRAGDAAVHLHLGQSLHRLGRLAEAETHLRKAVELDGELAAAHHRLGAMLLDAGRRDEAIAALGRARQLDPRAAAPVWKVAAALAASGRVDAALVVFDEAGGIGGGKARDHRNWGIALLQRGRPVEAAARLEISVRLAPDDADAICMLGVALAAQGRTGEARTHYLRALELDPENVARTHLQRLR